MTDLENKVYIAVKVADKNFQDAAQTGTKNWLRNYFLPALTECGLSLQDEGKEVGWTDYEKLIDKHGM
jgi:hypothetical protein